MSPRPVAALALFAAAVVVSLSGCAPTVSLDPAPNANSVGCAQISVRLPDTVAGQGARETDAQATGAWGTPATVLLRCGVPPLGPTTQPCVTVNGVDWVLEGDPAASTIRYITFGRNPATEVIINHGAGGVSDASVLPDLASAISVIPQTSKCLALSDVGGGVATTTPTPTATPAPTSTPTP
ncbi:MAG: hypothetical protein QOE16_1917 [Microbacteriaceae bacterium]|jgi:hypothetical protein|nr:hypothetical protein [Microbacteriaceae bacterium]